MALGVGQSAVENSVTSIKQVNRHMVQELLRSDLTPRTFQARIRAVFLHTGLAAGLVNATGAAMAVVVVC